MAEQMPARDHYERGQVLKQVHMLAEAIEAFKKASRNPDYAGKAHVQIALCLKAAERHEEAVMAFRHAAMSPMVSSEDQRHILYHMGHTLELLGRYAESLEVYGWIRRDAPGFRDVAQRIKHLISGERTPVSRPQGLRRIWMKEMHARGQQLMSNLDAFLAQTGQWLKWQVNSLKEHRLSEKMMVSSSGAVPQPVLPARNSNRHRQLGGQTRGREERRHSRAPVCLRSHFSAKDRMLSGEGVLRDLSPWGCRITSVADVPVGERVECCIFPQDAAHPFIIEGATVRWINAREFGLAFTSVRPAVQRQIAQLCEPKAA